MRQAGGSTPKRSAAACDQQRPRRGAGLAVAVELGPGAGRAAGHLHAEGGVGVGRRRRRVLDLDLLQSASSSSATSIGSVVQMPWPISECGEQHGDGVVGADAQERVGRERACRRRGSACAKRLAPGTVKAMTRPPVTSGAGLEELAAGGLSVSRSCGSLLSLRPAARCTAARMRW